MTTADAGDAGAMDSCASHGMRARMPLDPKEALDTQRGGLEAEDDEAAAVESEELPASVRRFFCNDDAGAAGASDEGSIKPARNRPANWSCALASACESWMQSGSS